jgi:hypothetical protein
VPILVVQMPVKTLMTRCAHNPAMKVLIQVVSSHRRTMQLPIDRMS